MSFRRGLIGAMLGVTIPISATLGDEVRMTDAEIKAALISNTVHGLWGETEYYSYFDASGQTIYTTKAGADTGTWSVKNDQYCSVWAGTGEDCYTLLRDESKIIWIVPESGKRYDSTLIEGRAEPAFQ